MQTSTIRPGLLVSLKTTLTGNVQYQRADIEPDHIIESGERRARWETERVIEDPAEHEAAVTMRGKCRNLIRSLCSVSSFGLLCPESRAEELGKAVEEAQRFAAEFNRAAKLTRISVYVIAGRIAPDDVEAVRAINSEIRDLMTDMETGLRNLDVKTVREAAAKARGIGQMLSSDARARVQTAIDAARSAARKIVKAGEAAAAEIDHQAIRSLAEARTAFLDLDEADNIVAPTATGRAIDLSPTSSEPAAIAAAPVNIDL